MDIKERSVDEFVRMIRSKSPFSYSRWGDGEWKSIFGYTRGFDRDGHAYFPQMAVDLRNVLASRPAYSLGLPGEVQEFYGDNVKVWIGQNKLHDLDWINADVFHDASASGKIDPLIAAIQDAPSLVVVGPPHLAKLKKLFDYTEFVCVPPRNAYLAVKSVLRETLAACDRLPAGSLVSVSAGMPAKVLVDSLHRRIGGRHQIVDFGSVWDRFVGVPSRSYMRRLPVGDVDDD